MSYLRREEQIILEAYQILTESDAVVNFFHDLTGDRSPYNTLVKKGYLNYFINSTLDTAKAKGKDYTKEEITDAVEDLSKNNIEQLNKHIRRWAGDILLKFDHHA